MSEFHIAQMNVGNALHPVDMKPEPYCVGWS